MPGLTAINSNNPVIQSELSELPKSVATGPQQVSQTQSARTRAVDRPSNSEAISLEKLTSNGGLRRLTEYRPSVTSWISTKVTSAIHFLKGEQAVSPAVDRRGITTFRELERLADKVATFASQRQHGNTGEKNYRESLESFHAKVMQYMGSKPQKLEKEAEILSCLRDAISNLQKEQDPSLVVGPQPDTGESSQNNGPVADLHQNGQTSDLQPTAQENTYAALRIKADAPEGQLLIEPEQVLPTPTTSANGSGLQSEAVSVESKGDYISYGDQGHTDQSIERASTNQGNYAPLRSKVDTTDGQRVIEPAETVTVSANNAKQSHLEMAEANLKSAGISIPGITSDQKIRLAGLLLLDPGRARQVAHRAAKDATDLNILLADAQKASFETRSVVELVVDKRSQLTRDTASGGLGVNPAKLNHVERIGGGNFGEVHLYESQSDDPTKVQQFAGKVMNDGKGGLWREEAMLARLPEHENLIKSYGIHTVGEGDQKQQVLLQEYVSGKSLSRFLSLSNWESLPADKKLLGVKHVATQVFRGLAELQKLGLVHADIRADNLLFDKKTFCIKIADFGQADVRGVDNTPKVVPVRWASPEILKRERGASIVGDSFSAGRVLVGELIKHFNLFNKVTDEKGLFSDSFTNKSVADVVLNGGDLPEELSPKTVEALAKIDPSGKMAEFFAAISNPNPNNRMRPDKALEHEFLANPPTHEELVEVFNSNTPSSPVTFNVDNSQHDSPTAYITTSKK